MHYAMKYCGKLGVAITVAAAALGASWAIGRLLSNPVDDSYPDAPFDRLDPASPRIFVECERPTGRDAEAAWVAKVIENNKYYEEKGAFSRATPDEQAAVKAARNEKYVHAWELAGKILRTNPQSVPALNALASAELYGEENLPRALTTIRRARHLLEQRGQDNPHDADAREWYLRCLSVEREVLYRLAQHEAALRVIELMEQIYQPLPHLKFWHYIKLRRLDDAQQPIAALEQSGKWPSVSANDKLILAGSRQDRVAAYEASRQIATTSDGKSAVLWKNFASMAQSNFCLDEMEQALQKSLAAGEPDFRGSTYEDVVMVHLQQGDFVQAAADFKLLQSQRGAREPSTLTADQSTIDRQIALFLVAVGRAGDAERYARQAYEFPSRNANTSSDPVSGELADTLTLWTVLQAKLHQLESSDFLAGTSLAERTDVRASLAAECWRLRTTVLKILSDPRRINPLLPYALDEVRTESWMAGQFLQVLPLGAGQQLLRQARESEQHPAAAPYLAALEAEAALLAGNPQRALEQAQTALGGLHAKHEKLLRARINAVAAEASRLTGNRADYLRRMDEVLTDFPGVLRLLHIAVPVRVQDDGDPQARRLAAALTSSKLLQAEDDGFALRVARQGTSLVVTLYNATGGSHLSFTADTKDGKVTKQEGGKAGDGGQDAENAEDALIRGGLRRFGDKLFSPWLDLTPVQINGLGHVPYLSRM